jgi:hypothetical protein
MKSRWKGFLNLSPLNQGFGFLLFKDLPIAMAVILTIPANVNRQNRNIM